MSTNTQAKTHKKSWPILRALFSRTTFLVLFLIIQIVFMWAIFTFLNEELAYGFFIVLSALEILVIMNQEGSSAFKIAWVVPIILFPVFGALFYLYIRLQTRVKLMRHNLDLEIEDSEASMGQKEYIADQLKAMEPQLAGVSGYLNGCCHYPTYDNTYVRYFPLGDDLFPVMLEELKKAQHFIFMEFFIVAEGKIWSDVLAILKEKAAAGVTVKFMYDGMNSIKNLPFNYDKELCSYGIDAKQFSPVRPAIASYQNNRDHRKICVIDGHTAFTGGVNLADEYANLIVRFGKWKDTGAMFKGEAVNSFTMMFLQMWNSTYRSFRKKEVRMDYAAYAYRSEWDPHDEPAGANGFRERPGYVIPYGDNPLDQEPIGESVYLSIINEAREYVHIMTPYLILDDTTMSALCYAAKRGVDVKILFPHIPDKPYAFWLGHAYYKELLENGVRIFEYLPGFVHAKEFVSDGIKGVIGTINLDFRSLYLHFENAAYLYNVPAIADMEKDFDDCLKESKEIDLAEYYRLPPLKIFFGKTLRVLAPLF